MIRLKPRLTPQPLYIAASPQREVRKRRAAGHYPPPHNTFVATVLPRAPAAKRVQRDSPDPVALVDAACRRRQAVRDVSPGHKRHCGRAYSGPAHVVLFSLPDYQIVAAVGVE